MAPPRLALLLPLLLAAAGAAAGGAAQQAATTCEVDDAAPPYFSVPKRELARRLQRCDSGYKLCGGGCCPNDCSSCSSSSCTGCKSGGVDGATGMYIGIAVGATLLLACIRFFCSRKRRGAVSTSEPATHAGDETTYVSNPASKDAVQLLRELAGARDHQTAFMATVAFNEAKWTTAESERLSVEYCLAALSNLRTFAAGSPMGAAGVEAAAKALYWLSGTSPARALLVPTDAVPLLVSLLQNPGSAGVAANCCEALVRLAYHDDMEARALSLGALPLAIHHLRIALPMAHSSPGMADACGGWAQLLGALGWATEQQQAAYSAGALPLVLSALTQVPCLARHAKAARWLALAMKNMAWLSDEACVQAVSLGGLQACVALLAPTGPLADNAQVAAAALEGLSVLANVPAHVLPAINTGAFAAALARVEQPSSPDGSADVLLYAARFLGKVARSSDGVPALAAGNMRAVRAVVALRHCRHAAESPELQKAVERALEQFREAGLSA